MELMGEIYKHTPKRLTPQIIGFQIVIHIHATIDIKGAKNTSYWRSRTANKNCYSRENKSTNTNIVLNDKAEVAIPDLRKGSAEGAKGTGYCR